MKHFGIIGKPLAQSFSANYFNKKFAEEHIDAEYSLYPLEQIEEFRELVSYSLGLTATPPTLGGESKGVIFTGMNVTIPYKTAVIPYLTDLDETAREIGAVNVIRFMPNGRTIGFNTDALGFMESIRPMLRKTDRKALILGTGGAAKACFYGLRKLGLEAVYVSRTPSAGQLSYNDLQLSKYDVIVNCTPLGMYPETEKFPPLPYEQLTQAQFLFDCIYNPEETVFLRHGREHGCRIMNGMGMLLGQAEAAWHLWCS